MLKTRSFHQGVHVCLSKFSVSCFLPTFRNFALRLPSPCRQYFLVAPQRTQNRLAQPTVGQHVFKQNLSPAKANRLPVALINAQEAQQSHWFWSSKFWTALKEIEWRRYAYGDFALPYSYKRIMKLKVRDGVPVLSDLVYVWRFEGYFWMCVVGSNIIMTFLTAYFVYTTFYQPVNFKINPRWSWTEKAWKYLYETRRFLSIYVFAAVATFLLNVSRRRALLRCYYEKSTELFHIISLSFYGGKRHVVVKAGSMKPFKRSVSILNLLGSSKSYKDDGSVRQIHLVNSQGFVMPWYLNKLYGMEMNTMDPLTIQLLEPRSTALLAEKGLWETMSVEERLARLNAEKLEMARKQMT